MPEARGRMAEDGGRMSEAGLRRAASDSGLWSLNSDFRPLGSWFILSFYHHLKPGEKLTVRFSPTWNSERGVRN